MDILKVNIEIIYDLWQKSAVSIEKQAETTAIKSFTSVSKSQGLTYDNYVIA